MVEKEPKREYRSKLLEDAERGRQENYTNHLFALHHSEMPDWSEEVLRRVRGEAQLIPDASQEGETQDLLPAPSTSASSTTTGGTSTKA